MNKKGGLLLAAAAAYAYYKYTKMTPDEKKNIKNKFNETTGKVLENLPKDLKSVFNKTEKTVDSAINS